MLEYRRKDLDLSTRIFLGIEMLYPAEVRGWGRASELAEVYGISRSMLYQIKDRVQEALEAALKPKPVGRPAEEKLLRVDRDDDTQSDCRDARADGIGAQYPNRSGIVVRCPAVGRLH